VPVFVAKLPSGGWQYYDPDPALRHYVGSFRWTNWNNMWSIATARRDQETVCEATRRRPAPPASASIAAAISKSPDSNVRCADRGENLDTPSNVVGLRPVRTVLGGE
jgi:hypothetical protein